MKTVQVTSNQDASSAARRKALAAALAQGTTAGTATHQQAPAVAGAGGLALALGNFGASAIEGIQAKRFADQQAAGIVAAGARGQHMVDGWVAAQHGSSGGASSPATPGGSTGGSTTGARVGALSDEDRDLVIRTVAGEAGGESPDGQAGVASVIRNRMASGNYGGNTARGVVMAPKQFSLWNPGDKAGDLARNLDPNSPQYQRIGSIVDGVFGGTIADPTNGADHYYNPHVASPAWGDALAARNDVTIGNHRFVGGAGDPGIGRTPATPAGQLAAMPGSTVTPPNMPDADPGMMASGDLPAPNAAPVVGKGLPGDMQGASLSDQAPQPGSHAHAMSAALADGSIPGSAFIQPAGMSGGVVDANVSTSPSSVPAFPGPQQRALASALMTPNGAASGLTPADPNGAPDVMTQQSDLMNNAPRPDQGGMNDSLGGFSGSPYGQIPVTTGDPSAQSLAFALGQQIGGQSTAPSLGTDATLSQQNARSQAQGGAAFPADVGAAIGADSGVPAILGASFVSDKAKGQGGTPFADMSGDIRAGSGSAPQMAGADVPLPPVRPSQAMIDALGSGLGGGRSAQAGPPGVDPASTGSIDMGGPQRTPDVPAPNAVPAIGQGIPASAMAAALSPIGKQATETSPQAFNLQQAGGPGGSGNVMADALGAFGSGATPAAPAPAGSSPAALAGALGQGSAFRTVMDGGDIGQVAQQQDARLNGGGQPTPQRLATANVLGGGTAPMVIPAPAGAPPSAASTAPSGAPAYLQDAMAMLGDPYASTEQRAFAKDILEKANVRPEAYTLSAGQARFDGNNRQVAAVPKDEQDRYDYREVAGRLLAVNKANPADVHDVTPAGLPSGYRPATPEERQAYGVTNGMPMVIGPDGKPSGLTGGTTVNVGGSEPASEKAYGEAQGKHFGDILNAGETARQTQGQLSLMNDAFNQGGGNITTGPFAKSILAGKQAIQGITGIDLGGIPESEAINKLGFGLATSLTKEITARPAQAEFLRAIQNVPGIFMSPQGSKVMMSVLNQQAQQKVDLGELVQDPKNRANWPAVEREYYASHPLMSPFTGKPLSADDVTTLAGAARSAGVDPTTGYRAGSVGGGSPGGGDPQQGNGSQPAAAPALSTAQQQAASSTSQDQALASARAAIASGKSRTAVIQRLQQLGINPGGL